MFGIQRNTLVSASLAILSLTTLTTLTLAHDPSECQCNTNHEQLQADLDACLASQTTLVADHTHTQQQLTQCTTDQQSQQSSTTTLQSLLDACKSDSASIQSTYNDVLQSQSTLQAKYDNQQSAHQDRLTALRKEVKDLKSQLDHQKLLYKKINEKWLDAREEVQGMDKELRRIRFESGKTYVNTTLIVEDLNQGFVKYTDLAWKTIESGWKHPQVQEVVAIVKEKSRPLVTYGNHMYVQHGKPKLEEAMLKAKDIDEIESVRLTAVSFVQHGSKTILNYMFMTQDRDDKAKQETSKESGTKKKLVGGCCNCGGGILKKTFVKSLKYAEKNPDRVVYGAVGGTLALIVWKIVLSILYLFFYLIGKLLGSGKKKKKNNNKENKKTKKDYGAVAYKPKKE